ncbi:MAG: hypothetical protein ABSF28_05135 [Terracidiphilus sp.]|jgi:hypothetical protein
MARQAKLEDTVPTTLPDSFDHWDNDAVPPTTLPKDFDGFDDAPPPQVNSSAPPAVVAAPTLSKVAETPVNRMSVTPPVHTMPAPAHIATPAPKRTQELPIARGPALVPQPTGSTTLNTRKVTAAAPAALAQPAKYVTTEELSTLVQEYHATLDEESDGEKQRKKSLMLMWIGAIVLVLAIVAAVVVLNFHKPAEKSQGVVVVHPVVTYTPDATPFKEKPSPAKPAQHTADTSAPASQP